MRTPEEMSAVGKSNKGKSRSHKSIEKQKQTCAINKAIKNAVLEELKQQLLAGEKGKTYYSAFIQNYLSTALKDPESRAAATVAGSIFKDNVLEALDEAHEKEMANDVNFALYKLNESFFQEQRDVLTEINHSKKILVCCSRRAGKTDTNSGAIVKSALLHPGSRIIYINLNFSNAVNQIWDNVIKRSEQAGLVIKASHKNEGTIEWANGSSLRIKGNSNNAEADTLRGEQKVSLVVIDEFFHQRNMQYAINEVIMPLFADIGDKATLLCTGTPPRIPHTYGEKLWNEDKTWRHYHWTAEDNPYIPNFSEFIKEVAAAKGLATDAPFIQREYYGKIGVYDTEAQVFKNAVRYTGTPYLEGNINRIAIGVDYGFSDYNAIVAIGYNTNTGKAWVLPFTRKFNKATVSDIVLQIKDVYNKCTEICNDVRIYADTNEQSITYELFSVEKLPAYNAYKYNKMAAMAQLADKLRIGSIQYNDNILQDEFERTLYKRDDEDNILPEIDDDVFHPDAIMALLYASRQVFFDMGDKWKTPDSQQDSQPTE